jgi:hypothetical protein
MEATTAKTRPRKVAQIQDLDHNHNSIVASRSMAQLADAALAEGVMVAVPVFNADIYGYDAITECKGKFSRVQVRAAGLKKGQKKEPTIPRSFTFSIIRSKKKKTLKKESIYVRRKHFKPNELEAFIFIHVDYRVIFIVPVSAIDLTRTKFTVHINDCRHDAWTVLK